MSLAVRVLMLAFVALVAPAVARAEAPPPAGTAAKAAATKPVEAAKPVAAIKATDAKAGAATAPVDLNTASEAELKALPAIGEVYAGKIIAARPYANKAQLVSKKILSKSEYEKAKDLVVAKKAAPGPKAK